MWKVPEGNFLTTDVDDSFDLEISEKWKLPSWALVAHGALRDPGTSDRCRRRNESLS